MLIKDLITRSGSYRRFHENERIPHETLWDLVQLARLSPAAGKLR